MPRLFTALTFLLCSTAVADKIQRPTGFLSVPFGSAPAEVVRMLGSRGGGSESMGQPRSAPAPAEGGAAKPAAKKGGGASFDDMDDDIPF